MTTFADAATLDARGLEQLVTRAVEDLGATLSAGLIALARGLVESPQPALYRRSVGMEFRILGPLEAADDGGPVALGPTRQRALLALLLLNPGRTLPSSRLVDELWGDDPPASARKAIQIHVSGLRKLLPDGMLQTRGAGYRLDVEPDDVDLYRFERLRAGAQLARQQGRDADAARQLRDALALWRGSPLTEFESEPFAEVEGTRLEELRMAALEERIDADLELGRHADLVGELETLVVRHPMRERLLAALMLALYRSGRHADALAAFRERQHVLSEELGIQPSLALRQLELRILRHDPLLDGTTASPRPAPRAATPRRPPVRYARSGDVNIAYQITGEGPTDLVLVSGFISHLEKDWEDPRHAHFLQRLASRARLIRFDKRGTGLSDRPPGLPNLETRMDDVRAVMDAVDSRDAVLFGYSEGAPMAILFAATYPERTRALVLYGAYAKRLDPDDDYPWAPTHEARADYIERLERDWGFESDMKMMCPSADEAMAQWWGARCRAAASPGAIRSLNEMNSLIDVRDLLPAIRVPTLVVHRGTDYDVKVEEGRYVAARIPGARFVELPGADHFVAVDPDQILDVVEPFLAECGDDSAPSEDDRVLATLLVTELADPAAADDPAWRDLVERQRELVRCELARHRGRELAADGDATLAAFDGPARAIRCACAVMESARRLGLELRAGVHTGEVEPSGATVRGTAVDVTAAIAAAAGSGEVLVSGTVRDLVAGSNIEFADRGRQPLTGAPGEVALLAVADAAAAWR
jgi:DNA-binding SARP family transcriptional activator/pimeloyl-ACP methyl ester carboxylesterase/class 3 adenylate cyclase